MIKKTSLPRMTIERTSKALSCMKLKENDELAAIGICYENDDLFLITNGGMCNHYSSEIISDIAMKAQGVMGMNVRDDELAAVIIDRHDNEEILLSTNKGGFKRIHKNSLEYTSRNTKGYSLFKQIKSNPHSISKAQMVSSYDTLYISENGQLKELSVSEIPFMDTDKSFSNPLNIKNDYFYLKKNMTDITEVDIIDLPENYYQNENGDNEQIPLFD